MPAVDAGNAVQALLRAAPASVPALDVIVDVLGLQGLLLGRAEMLAVNQASRARPAVLGWRLTKLNVDTADASLRASGVWAPGSAGPAVGAAAVTAGRRSVRAA